MNFDMKKTTDKPQKNVVINSAGFGKATNNAIDILLSKGYFKDKAIEDFDLGAYKELSKKIYKTDLECIEELKNEL